MIEKEAKMGKHKGFTLAEVLITLVIIGVIAAITVPSLIQTTQKKENIVRFKKALSTINQALNRNYALYSFNMASINSNCLNEDTDKPENVESVCSLFNNTLIRINSYNYATLRTKKGTLYYQDLYNKGTAPDTLIKEQHIQLYFYQMITGELFAFHSPHKGSNTIPACSLNDRTLAEAMTDSEFQKYCVAFIDINGVDPPNKEVKCTDGKAHSKDLDAECTVTLSGITDVIPIALFDSTAAPASAAAREVLKMQ